MCDCTDCGTTLCSISHIKVAVHCFCAFDAESVIYSSLLLIFCMQSFGVLFKSALNRTMQIPVSALIPSVHLSSKCQLIRSLHRCCIAYIHRFCSSHTVRWRRQCVRSTVRCCTIHGLFSKHCGAHYHHHMYISSSSVISRTGCIHE